VTTILETCGATVQIQKGWDWFVLFGVPHRRRGRAIERLDTGRMVESWVPVEIQERLPLGRSSLVVSFQDRTARS